VQCSARQRAPDISNTRIGSYVTTEASPLPPTVRIINAHSYALKGSASRGLGESISTITHRSFCNPDRSDTPTFAAGHWNGSYRSESDHTTVLFHARVGAPRGTAGTGRITSSLRSKLHGRDLKSWFRLDLVEGSEQTSRRRALNTRDANQSAIRKLIENDVTNRWFNFPNPIFRTVQFDQSRADPVREIAAPNDKLGHTTSNRTKSRIKFIVGHSEMLRGLEIEAVGKDRQPSVLRTLALVRAVRSHPLTFVEQRVASLVPFFVPAIPDRKQLENCCGICLEDLVADGQISVFRGNASHNVGGSRHGVPKVGGQGGKRGKNVINRAPYELPVVTRTLVVCEVYNTRKRLQINWNVEVDSATMSGTMMEEFTSTSTVLSISV